MAKSKYPKIFEIFNFKALALKAGKSKGYFDTLNKDSKDNPEKITFIAVKAEEIKEIAKTLGGKKKLS